MIAPPNRPSPWQNHARTGSTAHSLRESSQLYFDCQLSRGSGKMLAHEMGVPFLGKVPLDPQVVNSGDAGTPFVKSFASSATTRAFEEIARLIFAGVHEKVSRSPQPPGSPPKHSAAMT